MIKRLLCSFAVLLLLVAPILVSAQLADHDTSYFKKYPRYITGRAYVSQKYTSVNLDAPDQNPELRYKPNNPMTVGVGASYGVATLNLGFAMPFTKGDRDTKGKTKFLDLQSHIYSRKIVVDLYGQFYKGYYLTPKGAGGAADIYYIRPDLKVNLLGASAYKVFNNTRFSYRAAFIQDEWQKKSAGTFLLGGEIYYGLMKGDSALIPGKVSGLPVGDQVYKTSFIEFGPGIGYAYTLVVKQHWFLTGSLTVNGDISFVKEYSDNETRNKTSFSPNLMARAVAGYNSDNWIATISFVNNNVNARGQDPRQDYVIRAGNVRVTLAKRFKPGKKLRKKLEVVPAT